ncbi:MAG: hypothetical protein ABIP30_03940 [Ferruginibacter sp.]
MSNRNEIQDELLSISPAVAEIPFANVFSVPDGYFNILTNNLLAELPIDQNFLDNIPKQPFSIPENYFDDLSDSILNKIKAGSIETSAEEILNLSPTIAGIGKRNVFAVPINYFDKNVEKIVGVTLPQPAKVITMQKRSSFSRYAVAAGISGLIGLSVISFFNNKGTTDKNFFASAETKTAMADAKQIIKNNSFDQELNTISDKDIEQYLEKRGLNVNAALVASSGDDNINLPAPEDYIINDNTLDNYLNKANLNN